MVGDFLQTKRWELPLVVPLATKVVLKLVGRPVYLMAVPCHAVKEGLYSGPEPFILEVLPVSHFEELFQVLTLQVAV